MTGPKSVNPKPKPRRHFDFAISYAGENRDVAEGLAELLADRGAVPFFDRNYQTSLYGRRLSTRFESIYGSASRFVLPIISRYYPNKDFTNYELTIALEEARARSGRFIIPIRLDDTPVLGLPSDLAYVDLRRTSLVNAADELASILSLDYPGRKLAPKPIFWVATFGTIVSEVGPFLPGDLPKDYISLCDWLEADLLSYLDANNDCRFVQTEASERDGEALSVRLGFRWMLSWAPRNIIRPAWWELLEILPFREVYPDADPSDILAQTGE